MFMHSESTANWYIQLAASSRPAGMLMWVFRNLKYPAEAKAKGIRGNVICAFVVEPDGQLSTVKVIKGLDPDLDAEAIRLVNAMPKWTPGKQNGEPVRVRYDLTVNFFMR